MIKICHMTSAHGCEDVRIFHKECVSLAKAGYDVSLVERGESYEKNGVHIVGVGEPSGGRLNRMTAFSKKVYKAALEIDADIYHFHDPELIPYGLKLKKKGKKVIFDSHERYTEQFKSKPYLPKFITAPMAKIYGKYEKWFLKKIDAVIFPCTMQGKNPFEGKCKNVAIISNAGLLEEFYDLYDADAKKKANQICYAGGLTKARGITTETKAAYRANAIFAVAGRFQSPEYEQELRSLPEYSCVEYKGELDRKGVMNLLSESMIGMSVLMDEGQYLKADNLPTKVYEYMAMGLPTILSKSQYNEKMTEQYHFGICIDPENVDEIADAIRYLLDNPEEARKMGENGRRAVKEKFNWGMEEKKLFALYEDILKDEEKTK